MLTVSHTGAMVHILLTFGTETGQEVTTTSVVGFHEREKKRRVRRMPATSFHSYVMCRGFHITCTLISLAKINEMTILASRGQRGIVFLHSGERGKSGSIQWIGLLSTNVWLLCGEHSVPGQKQQEGGLFEDKQGGSRGCGKN